MKKFQQKNPCFPPFFTENVENLEMLATLIVKEEFRCFLIDTKMKEYSDTTSDKLAVLRGHKLQKGEKKTKNFWEMISY